MGLLILIPKGRRGAEGDIVSRDLPSPAKSSVTPHTLKRLATGAGSACYPQPNNPHQCSPGILSGSWKCPALCPPACRSLGGWPSAHPQALLHPPVNPQKLQQWVHGLCPSQLCQAQGSRGHGWAGKHPGAPHSPTTTGGSFYCLTFLVFSVRAEPIVLNPPGSAGQTSVAEPPASCPHEQTPFVRGI